jgi:pimeloyl-ACP methyl ester carboxylesterase
MMAGFVLIHGSWHGGWCFDPLTEVLRAREHAVLAPTLPGMGGTAEQLGAVTLDRWADFAVEQCRILRERSGGPVVLAGHSRGGLVVSRAAERDPQAMDALAYVCAMMLPNGMSRADFKALEGANPPFDAIISLVAGGTGTVVDPHRAGAVFAQLSPPDMVAAAMARLMTEPHGPRGTRLALSAQRWGSLPRTYIECTEDRTIPITSQRRMQALCPGASVVTLGADHSPYLSMPEALASALEAAIPTPSLRQTPTPPPG